MKKTLTYIKVIIPLFSIHIFSQNLVLNPSFEDTKKCSESIGSFGYNVKHWSTPSYGSTDLFNSCTKYKVGIPNNFNGTQIEKSGKKYAGFYLFTGGNYREYIQGKLSHKLEKGLKYTISFFISLAENSDFAIKDIGFLLSEKHFKVNIDRVLSEKRLKKLNIKDYSIYKFEDNKYYDNKNDWTLVQMEFQAKGNENFVTIGNFNKNSRTGKRRVSNKNRLNMSYYYIDLVSIEKAQSIHKDDVDNLETFEQPIEKLEIETIEFNKDYTFTNVIFDFNSTELTSAAQSEITTIYKFLNTNDNTNIIISGHTDNIGGIDFNQNLSEKRANSVADFFKSLGLNKDRIASTGYGSSQPISTNNTEEGRNKNRRVEFKILQNN